MTVRVLVHFTKGLDDVALAEVAERAADVTVGERAERYAVLELAATDPARLRRECRTVDDVRLLVAGPATVDGPAALAELCAAAGDATARIIGQDGRAEVDPWSVTVSARRPVWRDARAWDPAPPMRRALPRADPALTARQPVDLRLQVDGDRATIGLSLPGGGDRRPEAGPRWPGGLRPSVAAALVRLAVHRVPPEVLRAGVYDPFCGSGTILVEAAPLSVRLFGSDRDPEAVALTRQRLAGLPDRDVARLRHDVFVHDVRRGFPGRVTARVVVGNLPWGKQVRVERHQEIFDAVAGLTARVTGGGGAGVFLTTHEQRLLAAVRKRAPGVELAWRRIGLLGQTPAIVIAHRPAG